jgi:hypothetical protein
MTNEISILVEKERLTSNYFEKFLLNVFVYK